MDVVIARLLVNMVDPVGVVLPALLAAWAARGTGKSILWAAIAAATVKFLGALFLGYLPTPIEHTLLQAAAGAGGGAFFGWALKTHFGRRKDFPVPVK